MPTMASKEPLKATGQSGVGAPIESPGLQWLWKYLADIPNPHILDCGKAKPQTLNLLIKRGARVYVGDLVTTVQRVNPMLWDRSQKVPVFLVNDFLAQIPNIPPESLHAIFCWHLLDLLPREALQPVMDRLYLSLRNGGVIFFLMREAYLQKGAETTWWLETLNSMAVDGEGAKSFPFPVVSGRDVEKYLPTGSLKSFLTRSGRREVLVLK
jgi:hypothetical protein